MITIIIPKTALLLLVVDIFLAGALAGLWLYILITWPAKRSSR